MSLWRFQLQQRSSSCHKLLEQLALAGLVRELTVDRRCREPGAGCDYSTGGNKGPRDYCEGDGDIDIKGLIPAQSVRGW